MTRLFKRIKLDENDMTEFFLLPDNLYNIFAFFTGRDLNIVRSTCRTWHQVSINPYFQEIHCTRMGIPHKMQIIRETSAKWEHGQVELGLLHGQFLVTSSQINPTKSIDLGFVWYNSGLKDGEYVEKGYLGHIKKHCFYKQGKLHGAFEEYWAGGVIRQRSTYKNGKLDGEYWYYSSVTGLLKEHYFFQNGIKNGKFETYSQSTELLEATGEYKMGKLNGLYKEWFPKTTQLKHFCYYVNGKYEGEYKRWHSNGTLHVDSIMKQNRTVSKQEFCVDGQEAMRL
jgi:antitoxin component YwqK of YwqJK toxin-antitoxin module